MTTPMLANNWAICVDRLKDRVNSRTFWEALEATVAITIEDGTLVVGLSPENYGKSSLITHATAIHTVTNVVQEVFGSPLKVSLIEGTTEAEWEATKEREVKLAALKQASLTPRPVTSSVAGGSWDALYEQMSRLFAQTPYRALPQGKARFANEALYILMDAMNTLYPNPADDSSERSLARVLERISNASEIPAPVLAFELERLRAWNAQAEPAE